MQQGGTVKQNIGRSHLRYIFRLLTTQDHTHRLRHHCFLHSLSLTPSLIPLSP